jgi:hypothetical protein
VVAVVPEFVLVLPVLKVPLTVAAAVPVKSALALT